MLRPLLSGPHLKDWEDSCFRVLALAMLDQAVRDTRSPGHHGEAARRWLAEDGLIWFEMVGIGVQPGKFHAWLDSGCPKAVRGGRNNAPQSNEETGGASPTRPLFFQD